MAETCAQSWLKADRPYELSSRLKSPCDLVRCRFSLKLSKLMAEAWNSDISSLAGTQAHHSKSIFCPHKSFNLSSHLKEPFFIGRKSRGCEEGIDVIRTHICFNLSSICNIRVILNGSQITPLSLIASTFLSLSEVIPFIWQKTEGDGQPAKPLCVISTVCSTDLICELSDWWHAQWETFFFFFNLKNTKLETMCHHQSSITCYWTRNRCWNIYCSDNF